MKKCILVFFLFSFLAGIYSEDIKISPDMLLKGNWSNNKHASNQQQVDLWGGLLIVFNKDLSCFITAGPGQGGSRTFSGKYEISGNKLNVYYEGKLILKNGIIKYDISNLEYSNYLVFENDINALIDELLKLGFNPKFDGNLFDLNIKVKEGISVKINGIDAVTAGNRQAFASEALNLREKPGINSKRIEYQTMEAAVKSSIPKDTYFIVLARTVNKDNVNNMNNYWYYIEYSDPVNIVRCWVFAEFVKFDK